MEQSSPITIFKYEDTDIAFRADDGTAMVNATQMARTFGKKPIKWLELPSTEEYLNSLSNVRKSDISSLVQTKQGSPNNGGSTWMHEDVALEFARWLSPMFAIWCNDRIKELFKNGIAVANPQTIAELRQVCDLQAQNFELQSKNYELIKSLHNNNIMKGRTQQILDAAIAMLPKLATTTDIASRYGMTAKQLNDRLEEAQIIHRTNGNIYLTEGYVNKGVAVDCPYCDSGEDTKNYLRWTNVGQVFLFLLIKHYFNTDIVWEMFDNGKVIIKHPIK